MCCRVQRSNIAAQSQRVSSRVFRLTPKLLQSACKGSPVHDTSLPPYNPSRAQPLTTAHRPSSRRPVWPSEG